MDDTIASGEIGMTKAYSTFAAGSALLALSACTTHLDVDHALASDPASRRGIAYFLPFTQFDAKTTWTLASCDAQGVPEIAVTFAATPVSAPDPDHLYTIDYASLDAISKTSSVKVDFYDTGAIKSINAAAEDRTAEIAGKAISAVGKIAKFGFIGASQSSFKFECSRDSKENLVKLKAANAKVTSLTAKLERATDALDALTVRVVRSGDATPAKVFAEQDRQIANVVATKLEQDLAGKAAARLLKKLSYISELKFPATSADSQSSAQELPLSTLQSWIGNLALAGTPDVPWETAVKRFVDAQSVYLELQSSGGWQGGTDYTASNGKAARRAGLRYRIAVPGTLSVCKKTLCSNLRGEPVKVKDLPVRILQRGTTFYLPFASAPFSNGSLSATFSEGGVMTSAGYEQKKAAGEAIAGLADLLADEIVTVGGVIRESKTTKLEALKERTDIATAKKAAEDAEKALLASADADTAAQSASLTADTTLKNAELANILADAAVRKARLERDAALAGY